jgi:hypothetical protein
VSDAIEMFGYGIGTNGAGGPGVLPTHGKLMLFPVPFAWVISRLLAKTLLIA